MDTSNELSIKICWYGTGQNIITHIKNLPQLVEKFNMTKVEIKNYVSESLNTRANVEGNTLKIAGLITMDVCKILFDEYIN
jgi:hypothetical protein